MPREESAVSDDRNGDTASDERSDDRAGRIFVFWLWMTVIVAGLTVMILLPLTGR